MVMSGRLMSTTRRRLGNTVDKFITRICPGDKAMWDQMTAEAERLSADHTPKSEAVASLIALAGNNPRAFGGIGGRSTKGLHRTTEGQAAPLVERGVVRRKFRHQVPTLRRTPVPQPEGSPNPPQTRTAFTSPAPHIHTSPDHRDGGAHACPPGIDRLLSRTVHPAEIRRAHLLIRRHWSSGQAKLAPVEFGTAHLLLYPFIEGSDVRCTDFDVAGSRPRSAAQFVDAVAVCEVKPQVARTW